MLNSIGLELREVINFKIKIKLEEMLGELEQKQNFIIKT